MLGRAQAATPRFTLRYLSVCTIHQPSPGSNNTAYRGEINFGTDVIYFQDMAPSRLKLFDLYPSNTGAQVKLLRLLENCYAHCTRTTHPTTKVHGLTTTVKCNASTATSSKQHGVSHGKISSGIDFSVDITPNRMNLLDLLPPNTDGQMMLLRLLTNSFAHCTPTTRWPVHVRQQQDPNQNSSRLRHHLFY